jgi:hypothetical protein
MDRQYNYEICFRLKRGANPTIIHPEENSTIIEDCEDTDEQIIELNNQEALEDHGQANAELGDDQEQVIDERIRIMKQKVEKFRAKEKLKSARIVSQNVTIESNKTLIQRLRLMINATNEKNEELEKQILQLRETQ